MSKKAEVTMDAPKGVKGEPTPTKFEYGDLQLHCSHCGHVETVEKGIKDGLQFVLPTTNEHKLKLACSKCGVSLLMNFKESDEDTKKEAKEKYDTWVKEQAELKEKAEAVEEEAAEVIEEQDALLREDTKEEAVQEDN